MTSAKKELEAKEAIYSDAKRVRSELAVYSAAAMAEADAVLRHAETAADQAGSVYTTLKGMAEAELATVIKELAERVQGVAEAELDTASKELAELFLR